MSSFELCLEKLKENTKNMEISTENILIIVKCAMEIVEITELKGTEQKDMVIKIVKKKVEDSELNDSVKNDVLNFINSGAIGATIEIIVDASKGKLKINLKKKFKKLCCM